MTPKVSCLMPTYNRRRFVPAAIKCFLNQSYEGLSELVILGDGEYVGDLVPDLASVRYEWSHERSSLGAKRNRLVEMARGEIFLMWDDDDYHGPDRVRRQVEFMIGNPLLGACFLKNTLAVDLENDIAAVCSARFDATIAFRRNYFDLGSFCEEDKIGSGSRFYQSKPKHLVGEIEAERDYICVRHGDHKTTCSMRGPYWSPAPGDQDWVRLCRYKIST